MLAGLPFPLLVILVLLCAGFFAWLISKVPATAEPYKSIAMGFVGFCVVVWLIVALYQFFWGAGSVPFPHPRG